jgi:hypothetical protein
MALKQRPHNNEMQQAKPAASDGASPLNPALGGPRGYEDCGNAGAIRAR